MILKVGSDLTVSAMNVHIVDLPIAVYSARALHDDWNVKYKSTHQATDKTYQHARAHFDVKSSARLCTINCIVFQHESLYFVYILRCTVLIEN